MASIGIFPARLNRMVLYGIHGVLVLGMAREVFVLASGKATALRGLRRISLKAEQTLASFCPSFLLAARLALG